MATLTVRNLDEAVVRRLRVQAAEHGRSAEAEHREILRVALSMPAGLPTRQQVAERLADFRRRTRAPETSFVEDLLTQSRTERLTALTGGDEAL